MLLTQKSPFILILFYIFNGTRAEYNRQKCLQVNEFTFMEKIFRSFYNVIICPFSYKMCLFDYIKSELKAGINVGDIVIVFRKMYKNHCNYCTILQHVIKLKLIIIFQEEARDIRIHLTVASSATSVCINERKHHALPLCLHVCLKSSERN